MKGLRGHCLDLAFAQSDGGAGAGFRVVGGEDRYSVWGELLKHHLTISFSEPH